MVTFAVIIALLSLAALVGMVVAVGDKTPAVAAATAESAKADSHSSWVAVRAQILWPLGAEAMASRTLDKARCQRKAAKRHLRWERKAAMAEVRAQALAEAKARRLEARTAAKAAQRTKSAAVALRYGHAAARGLAEAKAHRRLVAAGLATPVTLTVGIKAAKRAERGSTSAANARKRAQALTARQEVNARKRVAADAANAEFAAEQAVKRVARAEREAQVAARRNALANISWEQSQLAKAVLRLERKALAKASLVEWLAAGNGQVNKATAARLAEAKAQAGQARTAYVVVIGLRPELAANWAAVKTAKRAVKKVAA